MPWQIEDTGRCCTPLRRLRVEKLLIGPTPLGVVTVALAAVGHV